MADSSRLEELRRRVQQDPASIAFAALAEEYRRAGRLAEAVDTCRLGLEHHPTYPLARVTLGRALLELGQDEEAGVEFRHVLEIAPENLAARRGLAEVQRREGDEAGALEHLRVALSLAPQDAELRDTVTALERSAATVPPRLALVTESSPVGRSGPTGESADAGTPDVSLTLIEVGEEHAVPPGVVATEPVTEADVPAAWEFHEPAVEPDAATAELPPAAPAESLSWPDDATVAASEPAPTDVMIEAVSPIEEVSAEVSRTEAFLSTAALSVDPEPAEAHEPPEPPETLESLERLLKAIEQAKAELDEASGTT